MTKRKAADFKVHPDQLEGLGPHSAGDDDALFTEAAEAPPEELEECQVAAGRNVHIPTSPPQYRVTGYDVERRRQIRTVICTVHGPGETVRLPKSEVARLRETGHVHDPNKIAPTSTVSPLLPQDVLVGKVNGNAGH
jgi:hypothetical protein